MDSYALAHASKNICSFLLGLVMLPKARPIWQETIRTSNHTIAAHTSANVTCLGTPLASPPRMLSG